MQYQRPALVQRQELKMTPQLLQSIQILTLPLPDLQTRIQEELEVNPALEIVRDTPTESLNERAERGEEFEYFENSSDPGYSSGSRYDGDEDAKRMYMESALSRPESLEDHLIWQLRLQPIDGRRFEIAELLVSNLDENGFHLEDPSTLVPPGDLRLLEEMIELIRTLDPIGTCVDDYRESLSVQASLLADAPPYLQAMIDTHLEALERGKTRDVARALSITEEEVVEALDLIKTLNPFPGRAYSTETPQYVVPDLLLMRRSGQFYLVLNDEVIPVLGVQSDFDAYASDGDKQTKKFAGDRVRNARWFINSIQQRNDTILKVGQAIIEFQRDFFLKGKKYLVPLTLREIAAEVGVSEATVSRVTNGKYLQTEWGVFELKHFFSNSIAGTGSGGSRFSKEGVKETVREILEAENETGKHLSDQKISEILAQRGIKIARRTVAKYRNELKISSSYER
jgi:RNA polymerase sigma-54 factor